RAAALVAGDAEVRLLDHLSLGIDLLRVLALGVAGAAEEPAGRALAFYHRLAALVALDVGRFDGDDRLALPVGVHARLALGIARAAQERGVGVPLLLPVALLHRLAARRAGDLGDERPGAILLPLAWLDVVAPFLVARAADELAFGLAAVLPHERP